MNQNNFKIGQFRRPQCNEYLKPFNNIKTSIQQVSSLESSQIIFKNQCINLQENINNQNCYYLHFGVEQQQLDQVFNLKLKNTNENDEEQLIEEFKVNKGTGMEYFEIIISPNNSYNQILWDLQRSQIDYTTEGRIMKIEILEFSLLVDIISSILKPKFQLSSLKKIGIQGPPSLLMCINRQQIRIGRSGIYEINNGININSISFVPKNSTLSFDGLDYFIMDFEY